MRINLVLALVLHKSLFLTKHAQLFSIWRPVCRCLLFKVLLRIFITILYHLYWHVSRTDIKYKLNTCYKLRDDDEEGETLWPGGLRGYIDTVHHCDGYRHYEYYDHHSQGTVPPICKSHSTTLRVGLYFDIKCTMILVIMNRLFVMRRLM